MNLNVFKALLQKLTPCSVSLLGLKHIACLSDEGPQHFVILMAHLVWNDFQKWVSST